MSSGARMRATTSSGGGGGRGGSLQRQHSSSPAAAPSTAASDGASYETDEQFAEALSSYDVPQVADALRRYLALEVQASLSSTTSKQQSAQIKGKFYERFNQILDRVFGNDDVSKHKFGGWLDYSVGIAAASADGAAGPPPLLKKKRSAAALFREADLESYIEALSANGRALLRLLGGGKDDDGSIFQFLFRVAHPVEFKLELDMLPEQSKMSIMTRSAYTSVLFTQLLHKPLAKQLIDLRTPVLLVTIKELYLFYFLRHPASASHQSAPGGAEAALSSSIMGSLSESFGKTKRMADYSWRLFFSDGFVSLTKGNPYNVLLLQYLRTFLPETSKTAAESRFHAKVLQHSNLFLHILIEFWLRQNLIVFSDEPLGAQDVDGGTSAAAAAAAYARAPAKPASPLAAVQTYTSYMAPSDDLLSSLLMTIIHLLSDSFYPAVLAAPPAGSTPSKSGFHPSLVTGGGGGYLTTSVSVMRRPLYEFFRLVFSRAPIGLSPTAFLAITDVWLAYIQPWCCRSWAEGKDGASPPSSRGSEKESDSSSSVQGVYTPTWATYVLANYHFYTVLLGGFIERAKELDFSGSDERSLSVLDRVLGVYTPELLGLLRGASRFLEKSQPFAVPFGGGGGVSTPVNNGRAGKAKSMLDSRDELSAAQGSILTFYTKALGIECTPVPLHGVFHRDAERLFDKLWSDSGASAVSSLPGQQPANAGEAVAGTSSSSDFVSSVFRAGGSGSDAGAEKYVERVQRLSRSLRRVFEISDAYVASSSHSRSLSSSFVFGGRESFAPSRDMRLPHLLTPEGVYQLLGGHRMCTPESATYLGDPMLRPICSFEIPFLVRASYKFSTWLNDQLGLPNPYNGKRFEDNLDVDPVSAFAAFRFNFRFLASKANLAFLFGFLVLLYALHLW